MAEETPRIAVYEGESVWLLGRFQTADGVDITQATVDSGDPIDVDVYRVSTVVHTPDADSGVDIEIHPHEVWQHDDPTTASVVFNALQTDGYWTKDSTGYNFRYMLTFLADQNNDFSVPEAGEKVKIELTIPTGSFGTIRRTYLVDILGARVT